MAAGVILAGLLHAAHAGQGVGVVGAFQQG